MPSHAFTIRKLAGAAGVGVEAVRYYQRRGLLHEPQRVAGGFREYSVDDLQRLRFIKRTQELGFSLDDVAELVALSAERDQLLVRELTQRRVADIRERIGRLEAMAAALEGLVSCCARSHQSQPCPIIAALTTDPVVETAATAVPPRRRTVRKARKPQAEVVEC